ncbi:FAD-dependent oxidoreductase [Sphingomicrobium flavum]|uniref:FAD-dependent oxidoreductase n=1 Tax=Sphingomicrobium flavum TaxID=1229164 RepID=UPI0021ADD18D|nr:FAD-dependent oxidoreductase [Sphingomicrobium flavum]
MDRRAFIATSLSAGLVAGCATVPRAPVRQMLCLPRLDVRPDRVLRTVAGLRPYREAGFVVASEPLGEGQLLVHNYGHGGAGITLSWGSSELAVDLGSIALRSAAAVLGAGVMGLTTARLLQERGIAVTIYTDKLPEATTSWVAGGQIHPASHYRGGAVSDGWRAQYRAAMAISWQRFSALDPVKYGIAWHDTYQQSGRRPPEWMMPYYPDFAEVRGADNPFPLPDMQRYRTMYVETPRYLSQLMADVLAAGGKIRVRKLSGREEMAALEERLVFNCTGLGARELVGDAGLVPMRGQLAILPPDPAIDYAYSLSAGYMFPRADGIILGGTFERGAERAEPTVRAIASILASHQRLNADSCSA